VLAEPPRWSEPRVKNLLKRFLALMDTPDHISCGNFLESDPVYRQVVNPDIKKLFEKRQGAKIYQTFAKYVYDKSTLALPSGIDSKTRALTTAPTKELELAREKKRRLDEAPPPILALEAGISPQTAKQLKAEGLSGSEIVEIFYVVRSQKTSGTVFRELRRVSIPIEDWEDIIDVARSIMIPVKQLCRFLLELEPEELFGVTDEFGGIASELAETARKPLGWGWWVVLKTYAGDGQRCLDRTWDILERSINERWIASDIAGAAINDDVD